MLVIAVLDLTGTELGVLDLSALGKGWFASHIIVGNPRQS
jgi:hypothetical protein